MLEVTPEVAIAVVVAALALFFDYFPGVASKFDALSVETKRLITVGLSVIVGAAAFAGQCFGWFETNLTCSLAGSWDLFYGIVLAVAINYGFHKATKPAAK
jgi:flavin reductase (DIM6/NTAB) family NADH-FMN oxidoreductase RutF